VSEAALSIAVAVAPLRREPAHESECVTQALHGERLEVLERSADGIWLRVRLLADSYRGWLRSWYATAEAPRFEASGWVRPRGTRVRSLPKRGAPVLAELPWPARVALAGEEKGWAAVRLEDGRDGFVASREVASGPAPGGPATGARLVRTARALLGSPYLWGGRSAWGFDCSGFVQSVFAWHGIALPRDSQEQWERGREGRGRKARGKARLGDLVFFGPDESRISHVGLASGSGDFLHAYGEVSLGSLSESSQAYVPELVMIFLGRAPWGFYDPSERG
jgi:hypothetical protein